MMQLLYLIPTTPDQRGPESNGNEVILHVPKSSRAGISQSDSLVK